VVTEGKAARLTVEDMVRLVLEVESWIGPNPKERADQSSRQRTFNAGNGDGDRPAYTLHVACMAPSMQAEAMSISSMASSVAGLNWP
jgi:hypothetical protein